MKTLTITLAIIMVCLAFTVGHTGTRIINYGFEDSTGNLDTTPGLVYSSSNSTYWGYFASCNVISSNCGGKTAHTGTYYIHRQLYDVSASPQDSCTAQQCLSINDHGNIGFGGTYPSESGDKTALSSMSSNIFVARMYFRVNGTWKTQSGLGNIKFFRLYGNGGGADESSAFVHIPGSQNNTNTQFLIYDPSTMDWGNTYYSGIDLQDGNWHSITVKVVRNNDTNSTGNITTSVWFDDWAMTGSALGTRTTTQSAFGDGFAYFAMVQNASATYPSSLMGIDFDDIEVWDGLPTDADTTPPVMSNPIPSGSQTCTANPLAKVIGVTTNEASTCKYSTTNQAYASMENAFQTTGSTTHSSVLSLACGAFYTYYVRCVDGSSNVNTSSSTISFSIAAAATVAGSWKGFGTCKGCTSVKVGQ